MPTSACFVAVHVAPSSHRQRPRSPRHPVRRRALEDAGEVLPERMLRFASWVGGDMDGNPNVDASTIRDTLAHHRKRVLELYREELHELFEHLSHSERYITPSAAVRERIARYSRDAGERFNPPERYQDMPYRNYVWLLWHRVGSMLAGQGAGYAGPQELIEDLELLRASLDAHGGTGSARVANFVRRVRTFGFHLATLDVRQDSAEHRAAVGAALGRVDFPTLQAAQRLALLHETLAGDVDPHPPQAGDDDALTRSINVMRAIDECRGSHGDAAIGGYIISMAEDALVHAAAAARPAPVRLSVFHGRGGTVSRGMQNAG